MGYFAVAFVQPLGRLDTFATISMAVECLDCQSATWMMSGVLRESALLTCLKPKGSLRYASLLVLCYRDGNSGRKQVCGK